MRWSKVVSVILLCFVPAVSVSLGSSELDDTAPPELLEFSLDPTEVDVTAGSAEVAVSMRVTDDLSGVDWVFFTFEGPSGQIMQVRPSLTSGTPMDGIYQTTVTFEQYSEEGAWEVSNMNLADAVGNSAHPSTSDLQGMGSPTAVQVIGASTAIHHCSWGMIKALYR